MAQKNILPIFLVLLVFVSAIKAADQNQKPSTKITQSCMIVGGSTWFLNFSSPINLTTNETIQQNLDEDENFKKYKLKKREIEQRKKVFNTLNSKEQKAVLKKEKQEDQKFLQQLKRRQQCPTTNSFSSNSDSEHETKPPKKKQKTLAKPKEASPQKTTQEINTSNNDKFVFNFEPTSRGIWCKQCEKMLNWDQKKHRCSQ